MQGQCQYQGKIIDDVSILRRLPSPLTLALALTLDLLNPNQRSNRAGFEYFLGH